MTNPLGPTVPLNAETFKLKVGGQVVNTLSFTLAYLKESFPRVEVVAALQVRQSDSDL